LGETTYRYFLKIVPKKDFFDFVSRYSVGEADYFVPARLSPSLSKDIKEVAVCVRNALKCSKLSRVDIILGKNTIMFWN